MYNKIYNNMEVMKFLGGCANNLNLINSRDMILNINDFTERFHKLVFATLSTMAREVDIKEIDGLAVATYLDAFPEQSALFGANNGIKWFDESKRMAKNSSMEYSMRTIRKYSLLRKYSMVGIDIAELLDINSTDLALIEEQKMKLDKMDITDIKNHFKLKLIEIENEYKSKEDNVDSYQAGEGILELIQQCKIAPKWGLPYQSKLLNTVLRGMQGSKLIVNSAGTGTGKSRFMAGQMVNISAIEKYCPTTKQWIKNNNPVPSLFISTELIREEIQTLLLACISGVPEEEIKNGEFGTLYEDMPVYVQSYEDLTFHVIRADDKVISLSWGLEGYDQGAHGWYTLYYMNYYTQTGERITFDSLGSGFRDKALELVTAKAAEMQAKEDCFFNDYEKSIKLVVLDGTEDLNAIYQEIYGPDIAGTDNGPADPTFYITEDGFVFESGQYVLQSYAVGIVDFEIPAADFGDDLTADIF